MIDAPLYFNIYHLRLKDDLYMVTSKIVTITSSLVPHNLSSKHCVDSHGLLRCAPHDDKQFRNVFALPVQVALHFSLPHEKKPHAVMVTSSEIVAENRFKIKNKLLFVKLVLPHQKCIRSRHKLKKETK